MTKEVMIKAIYEKIADKTLSFGCKVITIAETKKSRETEYKKGKTIIGIYSPTNGGFDSIIANGGKTYDISPSDKYPLRSGNYNKLKRYISEIIGHPVIIGDVLEYYFIEGKLGTFQIYNPTLLELLELWEYKRKPIEEQSEECIEYIYNLIK